MLHCEFKLFCSVKIAIRYVSVAVLLGTAAALGQGCIPTAPAGATVFNQIQQMSGVPGDSAFLLGWVSTQSEAGGTATGPYWMEQFQKSPSLTGGSAEIFAQNASGPANTSANALFYKKLGPNDPADHFLWDFYVLVDSNVQSAANNLEYDMFQYFLDSGNSRVYELMMGTQCNLITNNQHWDVWNSVGGSGSGAWVHTNVSCSNLVTNAGWHHIQLYGTANQAVTPPQYSFVCSALDGIASSLASYGPYQSLEQPVGYSHNLGVQWQLDIANAYKLHEWFDNATFTVWANQ